MPMTKGGTTKLAASRETVLNKLNDPSTLQIVHPRLRGAQSGIGA